MTGCIEVFPKVLVVGACWALLFGLLYQTWGFGAEAFLPRGLLRTCQELGKLRVQGL